MKCPACRFRITKLKQYACRSNPQNRYLHGVILPILADHTGYEIDEIKAVLKWKFKIKHTSSLSTKEFEDFLSKVRMWASAELGCFCPEPNGMASV
jgi:hypothetical protein